MWEITFIFSAFYQAILRNLGEKFINTTYSAHCLLTEQSTIFNQRNLKTVETTIFNSLESIRYIGSDRHDPHGHLKVN